MEKSKKEPTTCSKNLTKKKLKSDGNMVLTKDSLTLLDYNCLAHLGRALNQVKPEIQPSVESWGRFFLEINPSIPIEIELRRQFYLKFTGILLHLCVPEFISPISAVQLRTNNKKAKTIFQNLTHLRDQTESALSQSSPPGSNRKSPYYEKVSSALRMISDAQEELNTYAQGFQNPKYTKRDYSVLGVKRMVAFFDRHLGTPGFKITMFARSLFEKPSASGVYKATSVKLSANASTIVGLNIPEHAIRKILKSESIEERFCPGIRARFTSW